jgi:hypothetical protein
MLGIVNTSNIALDSLLQYICVLSSEMVRLCQVTERSVPRVLNRRTEDPITFSTAAQHS